MRSRRCDAITRRRGAKPTVWRLGLLEEIPCPMLTYKCETQSVGKKKGFTGSRLIELRKFKKKRERKKKVPMHLIKVSDCGSSAFINLVCSPHGKCSCWRGANPADGGEATRPNNFSRKYYKAEWPDMLMRREETLSCRNQGGSFVGLTSRKLLSFNSVNLVHKHTRRKEMSWAKLFPHQMASHVAIVSLLLKC